jgi:hypothetical protein
LARKFGLVVAGRLKQPALVRELVEQARVLDREGRLGGERPQQLDRLDWELAGTVAGDAETADQPALTDHRHSQDGPDTRLNEGLSQPTRVST